jgi:hypothetical protein
MRAALIALLLSGCATASVCPTLATYDEAFNQRLVSELEPLPEDSAIVQTIIDYSSLRDQVRACN